MIDSFLTRFRSSVTRHGWAYAGSLSLLALAWAPDPLEAQHTGNQLRSHSTQRQVQRPVDRHRAQIEQRRANRRLVSPLGSAANVRPGYYSQRLSQPVTHHQPHYPGPYRGYSAPYVVYVDPSPREPTVAGETPPPAYQPPPIYIVQPQPAPAPVVTQPPQVTAPPEPPAPAAPPRPRPTAAQAVSVSVFPADAEIYLDDEFVGTAASLGELSLRPGVYVLEVDHPEFSGQRLVFGIEDEPLTIAIDLTADRPNRRSRVK